IQAQISAIGTSPAGQVTQPYEPDPSGYWWTEETVAISANSFVRLEFWTEDKTAHGGTCDYTPCNYDYERGPNQPWTLYFNPQIPQPYTGWDTMTIGIPIFHNGLASLNKSFEV